jgi:hypothetical protein
VPGSILDLLAAAAGHPDPADQIAARLGQMPGQPGSPQGPQPLAGAAPPAGPPAGPGGPPGASGGPPSPGGPGGPAPPPPQPQATQTPPDLGQMFVQLMQRQQADQGFNRGLGMLAAGFAQPRDRATMVDAMSQPTGQDAGGLMGNLMKLQQYNIEQQQMAAYRKAVPGMLDKAGIDQSYAPLVMADPTIMSKVLETQAGVGGSPAWQAQMHAEKALRDAGQPTPWTPGDPDSYNAYKIRTDKEAGDRQKDLDADTANLPAAKDAYDSVLKDLDTLRNSKALPDILGGTNQYKTTGMIGLSSDTSNALGLYNKIMGGQYAAGVQDFKGAGRITQQELKQDLPSQSTMPDRNTDVTSFQRSIDAYKKKLQAKRAQLFGAAGQLASPDLSDDDYDKFVSPIYKPGGSLYVTSQKERPARAPADAPAATSSSSSSSAAASGPTDLRSSKDPDADYAKLPKGAEFIGPDGKRYRK